MIIAAYAGTGKTTFAARMTGAVDLASMPFCWLLPLREAAPGEQEGEKGALYHIRDPRFPDNYVAGILKAERENDIVLIPTNIQVVRRLEEYGRKVILCYPGDECREAYRVRFLARGNSEEFLSLFIDGWDRFLGPVRGYPGGIHIVLKPEEYLTDYAARFETKRRNASPQPVSEEVIQALGKKAAARTGWGLYLSGWEARCFYPISDLDDRAEREFLYRAGRLAYDRDMKIEIFPEEFLRGKMNLPAVDRDGLMALLEEGENAPLLDRGHPRRI